MTGAGISYNAGRSNICAQSAYYRRYLLEPDVSIFWPDYS